MIKSMTAYGKGQAENDQGILFIEIQSINRKFLDITINLPKELLSFDPKLREWLKPHIAKGQIQLRATFQKSPQKEETISTNFSLAESYKTTLEQLAKHLQLDIKNEILPFILQQPGIFNYQSTQSEESMNALFEAAFNNALAPFKKMKLNEGLALETDLLSRLTHIRSLIEKIHAIAKNAPNKFQEKLVKRLEEFQSSKELLDQRILLEIAIFADKVDVSEEIVRFQSHIAQFINFLASEEPVGKTLEFLVQEMFREINTMNAKIGDLNGIQLCLEVKGELEKIREQIQNVE